MKQAFDLGPQEWATLRRLLDEALDLPVASRAAWLDALPGDLAAYRSRLAALLANADRSTAHAVLNTLPKVETAQFAPHPGEPSADAARPIGPYRLLRELGSGGMASVWLAERTDMLQGRQVALKLPHGAWRRAGLAERLQREREILATLEHPHIARLYDAGVADDGQPYLALEYVQGEPIDAHCRRQQLSVPQRLQLFLQVLASVAHAHAHLVVHRDLKPSNILVSEDGQVKLLDFGIAKLLDQGLAGETALTAQVGRAFTPEYAAPEQIQGQALTTAADVYALGVVLFELLTDARPYTLQRASRAALEQAIAQSEVPRPSSVAAAERRRALQGDLDTIVLKALKKAPAERYATVNAFADDLRRHLANEPVLAQPDSASYRLGKLLARHRLAALATSAVALAVLAGAGVAVWQSRIAWAERDRATQVRSFIESIFRDADPYAEIKGPPTVAALLQRARQRVDRDLAHSPALRVEMLELIGSSLSNMNENDAAAQALEEAVRLGREALGEAHPSTLQARVTRLGLYRYQGRAQDSLADLQTLLPALRASPGQVAALVDALREQAQTLLEQGRAAQAEAPALEALKLGTQALGERHPFTAHAAVELAQAYEFQRRLPEAKAAAETALRLATQLHADNPRHGDVSSARVALGRALGELGEFAPAIAQVRQAVEDATQQFGPASIEVAFYQLNLAKFLIAAGDPRPAIEVAELASRTLVQQADPATHLAAAARGRLGAALVAARRAAPAEAALAAALPELQAKLGPAQAPTAMVRESLALALAQQGRLPDAQRLLDAHAAVASSQASAPASASAPRASELVVRAAVARMGGDGAGAEALARQALQAAAGATADLERMRVLPELGLALGALGRAEEALVAFDEALTLMGRFQTSASPERADVWLGRGRALLALNRTDQALASLQQAVAYWQDQGADARWLAEAQRELARARQVPGAKGEGRIAAAPRS